MDDKSPAGRPFVGYALRRVVVAPDLDALRGPLVGRWRLPLHFGRPGDRAKPYQLVLLEAGSNADYEQ